MNVHSIILIGLASCVTSEPNGSSDTIPLTCEIIAAPNCWTEALDAVASCAPGSSPQGVLATDGQSCTFGSGTTVTLSGSFESRQPFGFEVRTGGTTCVAFDSDPDRNGSDVRTLTTAAGTASWTLDSRVRLTCPDAVYETDLSSALACDGFPDVLGFAGAGDAIGVSFRLLGKTSANPDGVDVFSCMR